MGDSLFQWPEFITQVVTFVIFFLIMRKYAWPVVLNLLDERQRKIEEGFADIRRRQEAADKLHEEYAQRLRGIEQESRQRIQEAVNEGRRVAAELTEHARQESVKITERAQKTIELEMAKARVQLRDEIVGLVINASERLLREKLDDPADKRLVAAFVDDLEKRN
jgi:F-type H+-transporting ATPase subunit b